MQLMSTKFNLNSTYKFFFRFLVDVNLTLGTADIKSTFSSIYNPDVNTTNYDH